MNNKIKNENENIFDDDYFQNKYQQNINDKFDDRNGNLTDWIFIQKKLFQFLAAAGCIYSFCTLQNRTESQNMLLYFSCLAIAGTSIIREMRQLREKELEQFTIAHLHFFYNEIDQQKDTLKKIQLSNLGNSILKPVKINGTNKKNTQLCFWLSTSILSCAYFSNSLTFNSALLAGTLIWKTCNIAQYFEAQKKLKEIKKQLPKKIQIPVLRTQNER